MASGALLKHARSRAGLVVAGTCAACAWAAAPRPPAFDERTTAKLLGAAIGGEVDADGYVWRPSNGWVDDLYRGRPIVFLGRPGGEGPRDVFVGRVVVARDGRPLAVRDVRPWITTPDGDESDLVVQAGRVAFATRFQGRYQSVSFAQLDAETVQRVTLAGPSADLAFELAAEELVVRTAGSASLVDLATGQTLAGEALSVVSVDARIGALDAEKWPEPALQLGDNSDATADAPFPPEGFEAGLVLGQGFEPALSTRDQAATHAIVVDARQLEFALQIGASSPPSTTGFLASGQRPSAWTSRKIVAAFEVVTPRSKAIAGALFGGHWIAPMMGTIPVVTTHDGTLTLAPWSGEAWTRTAQTDLVQWSGDVTREGSHLLCVTDGGNLVLAWSDSPDLDSDRARVPVHCRSTLAAPGKVELATWSADGVALAEPSPQTLILAAARDHGPRVTLPKGASWTPAPTAAQPSPAFLPAVFQSKLEALGTSVDLLYVDGARFDWEIIAGADERLHRHGGRFPTAIDPSASGRIRLAFSLGAGKRKGPSGLRLDGSTGLDFFQPSGLLSAQPTLTLWPGDGYNPNDALGDVTGLPLTLASGSLSEPARERGPLQLRADLCVTSSGVVLVAQAEFDSHMATATVLKLLGCDRAVALDRGVERPAWTRLGGDARGSFNETALVGLERPLRGHVQVTSEQ